MTDSNLQSQTPKPKAISPLEHFRSQREWNMDRLNRAFARKGASRFFDFLTVGTSNKKPDTLVNMMKLAVFSCDWLVDVRSNPNSIHTPFWNKTNLSQLCATKGINYLHKPSLGVPGNIRKMLYSGEMTYPQFFEWYDANILVDKNLEEVIELTKKSMTAFMCTEIGPNYCHRHRIALRLESEFGYISYDL
jgi:uncharacterized protein (DUF488 family)